MASSNRRIQGRIRVLVGEDSPFMRKVIVDAISAEKDMEVVAAVADGKEVLKRAVELKPDCITLDLEMPRMDGLEVLRYLMSEWPTPVVIVSAHTDAGASLTIRCLEYGAVDFVPKGRLGSMFPVEELLRKVRTAAGVDVSRIRYFPPDVTLVTRKEKIKASKTKALVVIGASTGGPNALSELVRELPPEMNAGIIIVQHMPPDFTRYLAERLDCLARYDVKEADPGDEIMAGRILVAPGGMHLFIEERLGAPSVMLLERNTSSKSPCPSIDYALSSASRIYGENLFGVILTGMGNDGVAGAMAVKKAGGKVICQDEATSIVYGMPGSVARERLADAVSPLSEIPKVLSEMIDEPLSMKG